MMGGVTVDPKQQSRPFHVGVVVESTWQATKSLFGQPHGIINLHIARQHMTQGGGYQLFLPGFHVGALSGPWGSPPKASLGSLEGFVNLQKHTGRVKRRQPSC